MSTTETFPTKNGEFIRQTSQFRDCISREPGAKFPPEKGRYHLYVSYACPWAHRALIVRKLKGLDDFITFDVVNPYLDISVGWTFDEKYPDTVNGATGLRNLYKQIDPNFSARATVPTLFDKKEKTIVNNESAEVIRFFNTEFNDLIEDPKKKELDLYPADLAKEIDQLNEWVYDSINNGVYKAGFATEQEVYTRRVQDVFAGLDKIEKIIGESKGDYIFGDRLTEADIRLFTTIVRFDPVYVQHFKCNLNTIRDGYPNIHKWLRNLYWNNDAFKSTTDFEQIKYHYTKSHKQINPFGITPFGPVPNIKKLDG